MKVPSGEIGPVGTALRTAKTIRQSQILTMLRERDAGATSTMVAKVLKCSNSYASTILREMAADGSIVIAVEATPAQKSDGVSNIYKIKPPPVQTKPATLPPPKNDQLKPSVTDHRFDHSKAAAPKPAAAVAPAKDVSVRYSPERPNMIDAETLSQAREVFDTRATRLLLGRSPTDQEVVNALVRAGIESLK